MDSFSSCDNFLSVFLLLSYTTSCPWFFSFFQLLMNYQQLIINLENIIHSQHHCKKIVQEYFIQVGWDRRRAAEGCWVLETVSFVDDSPGCSLHCRCHSVPDTEPYMRGSTFCVRACVCACMHQCECVYLHLSTCQFTPVQKWKMRVTGVKQIPNSKYNNLKKISEKAGSN